MYIELESTSEIFQFDNLWYMGNSSVIYKEDDLLYKILDILISNNSLCDIGVLPIDKIIIDGEFYGMIMKYIPNTKTFLSYSKGNIKIDDLIELFIVLSNNLRIIHNNNIKIPDFHHNNILLTEDLRPYIDSYQDSYTDAFVEDAPKIRIK